MNTYRYPCTGNIGIKGFGAYLEKEIGEPRRNLRLFAAELSEALGCGHITLTNSGSSANLTAALAMAEKCRKAGKPLTAFASALTFPTTISSLLLAGFEVHLIDTEKDGFNMDMELLEKEERRASLIAVTHFLGFPCDMERLRRYADAHGCLILQDACETFSTSGNQYYRRGDITTLSFYHPHHLSSYGGGAVICRDMEDYILCDSIAHWGRACKCHIDESLCTNPDGPAHQFAYERPGVNVEMSELNACFGRWQLRQWDSYEALRRRNYRILQERLGGNPNLRIWPADPDSPSRFVFPIRLLNGMDVRAAWELLSPEGVEIRTLMGGATCTQPAFKDRVTYGPQTNANATAMADTTFFVGIHQTLPEADVAEVAGVIDDMFG